MFLTLVVLFFFTGLVCSARTAATGTQLTVTLRLMVTFSAAAVPHATRMGLVGGLVQTARFVSLSGTSVSLVTRKSRMSRKPASFCGSEVSKRTSKATT